MRVRERLAIRQRIEWDTLPEIDRLEWLAYDWLQQRRINELMDMLNRRVKDGKSVELTDYITIYLKRWGI